MWDLVLLLVQEVREISSSSQQRFVQEVWEFALLLVVQEVWDLVLLLVQEVIDFVLLLVKRCETSSYL